MKDFLDTLDYIKTPTIICFIILICFAFYFIKNYKTVDFQLKIIFGIFFFGIIMMLYFNAKESKNVTLLKKDFSLTTGYIEEYYVGSARSKSTSNIKYIYAVNYKYIEHSYSQNSYVKIPDDKPDLNGLYLVIYEKGNPENSFILLNYPVNNLDDLRGYIKLFEKKIPSNAIYED